MSALRTDCVSSVVKDLPGEPRSWEEVRFAASLVACPGCGEPAPDASRLRPSALDKITLENQCAGCGTNWTVRFRIALERGRPRRNLDAPPESCHLGGLDPSTVIRAEQFVAEIERLSPLLAPEPGKLGHTDWRRQWYLQRRLLTCVNELLKLRPNDVGLLAQRDRLLEVTEAFRRDAPRIHALEMAKTPVVRPRGELTARSMEMHRQWLQRGSVGEGRLDIADVDASGRRIGFMNLTSARLERVNFNHSNLAFAKFDRAQLIDVSMVAANLVDCSFTGELIRCDLRGANLAYGKLDAVVITQSRFDRAQLDRSLFRRAQISGARFAGADFGNTALDGTVFTDCDLRGASFSLHTPDLLGTLVGTRFQRCDLRDTTWNGRRRCDATFIE
jgi:uncharacterized protein YjbI with pentapeptide repeats